MTFDFNEEISRAELRADQLNPLLSALPRYKLKDNSTFWSGEIEIEFPAGGGGNAILGASFGRFLSRLAISDNELDIYLQRKLATAEHARKRGESVFGRLLNVIFGENTDMINLDRKHFLLCLGLLDEEPAEKIRPSAKCWLRLDVSYRARAVLLKKLAAALQDNE